MPIEVLMPALSPTMTDGNLVRWHKQEGDRVSPGDLLAEIETDKATMEVESIDDGVLAKILVPAGSEKVPVNKVIALIAEEGEDPQALKYEKEPSGEPLSNTPKEASASSASTSLPITKMTPSSQPTPPEPFVPAEISKAKDRIFITPLARRLATEKGIDLKSLQGTGPRGRIVKRDIQEHAGKNPLVAQNSLTGPAYEDKSISNMRKIIAQRLLESKQTVPHFYLTIDVNIDELLQVRKRLNEGLVNEKITVNDFVIRACALALRDVPAANTSWMENHIRYYHSADIAVAVAIEDGLITPIIKQAEQKSILAISREIKSLAQKARDGKLKPAEFQGGSFSISNLGMYGIKEFSAIINPPQACILAVGAGSPTPIVKDKEIRIATMMSATLSVDHRVVDGKVGAEFLAAYKQYMENPLLMMA